MISGLKNHFFVIKIMEHWTIRLFKEPGGESVSAWYEVQPTDVRVAFDNTLEELVQVPDWLSPSHGAGPLKIGEV